MNTEQFIKYRVRNLNEGKRFVRDLVEGKLPEIDTREFTLRAVCMHVSAAIEFTKTGVVDTPKSLPVLCGSAGDRCSQTKYGDRLYEHAFKFIRQSRDQTEQ